MFSTSLHFNLRRVAFILPLVCILISRLSFVYAQNGTSQISNSLCNLRCPLGYHCFNNTVKTTVIDLGHNGHICTTADQCYGESDPLGFVLGPRQNPQTVIHGDTVIIKPKEITLNLLNVSRDTFYKCGSDGELFQNGTSSQFQVPSKYLNPPGIKYFLTNYDDYSCSFGIRLELYVRSRQQPSCTNPAMPNLGVCSGVGFCHSDAKTFFTRNYSCLCCDAYKGRYCEELDSCHSSRNPCKNGATCTDFKDGIANSFNCTCVPGYEGTYCENVIKFCHSNPCKNGGFCVDYINRYSCLCQPGFNGPNCDIPIPDLCADNPCDNGGTCKRSGDKRQNYTCVCTPDFTGRNCTENITSSSILFTSTPIFPTRTSISVVRTSLVGNSSFVDATRLPSSIFESLSQESTMASSTSVRTLSSTASQRMSASSGFVVSSKTTVTSISSLMQQSVLTTVTSGVVSKTGSSQSPSPTSSLASSFSSVHKEISSLIEAASTSNIPLSSLVLAPTSVRTFSQAVTSTLTISDTSSSVTMSTTFMGSVSSKSPSTSSLRFTSSDPRLKPSSSSSLLFTSSPALTPTVAHSEGTSAQLPSFVASHSMVTLTSPVTTAFPSMSTVSYRLTIRISPSMSTVLISTSVMPTMPPTPTTVPLIDQTCVHNPCNNGTCFNEPYLQYEFRCECPYPTVGPICRSVGGECWSNAFLFQF